MNSWSHPKFAGYVYERLMTANIRIGFGGLPVSKWQDGNIRIVTAKFYFLTLTLTRIIRLAHLGIYGGGIGRFNLMRP